jgi:hypothetical protein
MLNTPLLWLIMLRNKSSSRFHRHKSAASLHSERIDPEVSRKYAQAAAKYAFARAQDRGSTDMSRRDVALMRERTLHRQSSSSGQTDQPLRRQQSVRFAGPSAVPRRRSIGRRADHYIVGAKTSSSSLRPRALTSEGPVPAVYRPPSRSSSIGKASVHGGAAESFITALAAYDEYYAREDDVASTPSSYKRIRKSKSMFSPKKAPSIYFHNGTPVGGFTDNGQTTISQTSSRPPQYTLKAPKSMSFLRGGRDHMTPRQDHDLAVQVARDKFLHQVEQQRLREKPSFLFRSKARRDQVTTMRKSVRSSSTNSYGMPIKSNNTFPGTDEPNIKSKARKASISIKNKFRKIFGRSIEDNKEATIPEQQVTAHATHVREFLRKPESLHNSFLDISNPNDIPVSRVVSRVPSLHAVPSSHQLRSRAGSLQSLRSESSATKNTSRVTSWNSTEDNTSVSRHAINERERQRLSIINENGTHISSATFHRQPHTNQFSAYPAFHRPSSNYQTSVKTSPKQVDSQRVYSALMKRLDENSPQAKLEAHRKASRQSLVVAQNVPLRSSSVNSNRSSRSAQTPRTIRQVQKSEDQNSCSSSTKQRSVSGHGHDFGSVRSERSFVDVQSYDSHNMGTSMSNHAISLKHSDYSAFHAPTPHGLPAPTPQELANRHELAYPQAKIVRERRSTFFPNATSAIVRTTSPYRKALVEHDYNSSLEKLANPDILSQDQTASSDISHRDADNNEGEYTESIYSRTTSGRTPAPQDSTSSLLLQSKNGHGHAPAVGTAILVGRTTYRPSSRPTDPSHRISSSAGSTEWKNWMSAQVSAISPAHSDETINVNYALPTMLRAFKHVRENAQIDDEDKEIMVRKVSTAKQPLGLVQQTASTLPIVGILKKTSTVSLREPPSPVPIPPPLPVSLPRRGPARLIKSKSKTSLHSLNTVTTNRTPSHSPQVSKTGSANGNNVLQKRNSPTHQDMADRPFNINDQNIKSKGSYTPNLNSGVVAAMEKQFSSTASRTQWSGMENQSPAKIERQWESKVHSMGVSGDEYDIEGTGVMGPALNAQAMGSKRMVDVFLSSRRRRIQGSEESNAFL